MKTDDLINMLANGDTRAPALPTRRILALLSGGVFTSFVLMTLMLGMRSNMGEVLALPAFWMKFLFSLALACIAWRLSARLALPGRRTGMIALLLALPLAVIWSIAAMSLMQAEPETRGELFWGSTWRVCPLLIATLSAPIFIAVLRAMRELAPTRLRLAGAAAGLAAGATAAAVYCLHCQELTAPFVGFWYVLGMLIPTALGALIGPRALRW
jgi:hypothetical protein